MDFSFDAVVNTGSQGCFIDKSFAQKQTFPLTSKSAPIRCAAFHGTHGVGGLVDHEWLGLACFGNLELPLTLGATNLGKNQAILGLTWLDSVHTKITCGPNGRLLEFDGLSVAAVDVEDICNVDFCQYPPPSSSSSSSSSLADPSPLSSTTTSNNIPISN